jgi:hypothetical protein
MTFNRGFECPKCGPISTKGVKKKSINKTQYTVCVSCEHVVTPWERPLKERAGCCSNCGHASFLHAIVKHDIHRCCKVCHEVYNVDKDKIEKKGRETNEHSSTL